MAKLLDIKFVIWGHGYNRKLGLDPKHSIESRLRLFFIKIADAYILYGQEGKKVLSQYIDSTKLFVAQNTLNTATLLNIRNKLESEGKINVKKRIGFSNKYNLIFVGRLLKSKYPDLLIKIYEMLKERLGNNICFHFIGDGEMKAFLENEINAKGFMDNFTFHGSIYDDKKIGELLFCSDLMVIPGYLGLSVNHAFCFDCPVISFEQGKDGPFHSPEVEYVINNETGFLIKAFDVKEISDKIYYYLTNKKLKEKMQVNIRNMIENVCSQVKMVDGFTECIKYCVNIK